MNCNEPNCSSNQLVKRAVVIILNEPLLRDKYERWCERHTLSLTSVEAVHSIRRWLSLLYFANSYLLAVVLPYTAYVHNVSLIEVPRMLVRFCCIDRVIVDKPNKGNDFLKMHTSCPTTLCSGRHHLYKPAYLIGCAKNWGIHYCAESLVFRMSDGLESTTQKKRLQLQSTYQCR